MKCAHFHLPAVGSRPVERKAAVGQRLEMGDSFNEQQEEKQRRFMSWAKEMGVEAPNISPATFAGGLRGMRADRAIGAGEDLVKLPRTSALQVEHPTAASFYLSLFGPTTWVSTGSFDLKGDEFGSPNGKST